MAITVSRIGILLVSAAFCLFTSSCGGVGGPPVRVLGPGVKPNVVVLPDDGSVTIFNPSNGPINLTGSVPPLSPGDIVVSAIGNGWLFKVTSVSTGSPGVSVGYTAASLCDVFTDASLHFSKTLGYGDFSSIKPKAQGIVISPFVSSSAVVSAGNSHALSLTSGITVSFTDCPLNTPSSQTSLLNGTVSFNIAVSPDIEIGGSGASSITFAPVINEIQNVTWTSTGDYSNPTPSPVEIAELTGNPISLTESGVPIVIIPVVTLYASASGKFSSGIVIHSQLSATAQSGLRYSLVSSWQPVSAFSVLSQTMSPSFKQNTAGDITFAPLHVRSELLINNAEGPYSDLDVPALENQVSLTSTNDQLDYVAQADFQGAVGIDSPVIQGTADYTDYEANINYKIMLSSQLAPVQ